MTIVHARRLSTRLSLAAAVLTAACSSSTPSTTPAPAARPDPRVGLKAGLTNAGEAVSNLKVLAKVPSPPGFAGVTNSDLTFVGHYAIQGNYNGLQVWDIANPSRPTLVTAFECPASQNDVSVYRNLLFMSAEANNGRIDCKSGGVPDPVSKERIRGIRIFDISDIKNPKLVGNVQTCRGSHTHTVVEDVNDRDNVYIYISGSSQPRPSDELAGCNNAAPEDPNSALLRIEIIKVPVKNPAAAAVVNRANIFAGLKAPARHGEAPEDIARARAAAAKARAEGGFVVTIPGPQEIVLGSGFINPMLDSVMKARGGSGAPTGADSTALRNALQGIVNRMIGQQGTPATPGVSPVSSTSQCHDITVYPALGLAGGACEGHGILLDIKDPVHPVRLDAVADSNFSYWHSATFNNDGTKLLFSDEWGGGGAPKCRATDKKEWGADAIFTIENRKLKFQSYYKIPAAQTENENCVAHNGSLIPIPGRDVMVQAWYQGGISVFDWTDAKNPIEIASFDRGPVDSTRMQMGGSWSVYWYNGAIVSSEIARGLDVTELVPSEFISQNEIDASNTVRFAYLNAQGQPKLEWPPSFPLAKSFVDQLERKKCLSASRISAVRSSIATAERASGAQRSEALKALSRELDGDARNSCDKPKVAMLQKALIDLSATVVP